ncbi:MAG: integrase core domain-containing protein [Proteobacteria bacterium]|nr:integrase core domain-containing protein [Pseudomonadota bacterium]
MTGNAKQRQRHGKHHLTSNRAGAPHPSGEACACGFFHRLKDELVHEQGIAHRETLRLAAFEYIEMDHHLAKRHCAGGHGGPLALAPKTIA